jgi:prophage DNA circulation protein
MAVQVPTNFTDGIFEQSTPCSFTVRGLKTAFAVTSIKESGGNRIVRRQRPYRDGAKLDDTGSKEKVWVLDAVFENSIDEPGIEQVPHPYPYALNQLLASFDNHETGDLELPTRGKIRCRGESYDRTESNEERDCARVSLTFVQDNEDNVDASSFQTPSSRATVRRDADLAIDGLEGIGALSDLVESLGAAAQDLQDALAAPGELVQDVDQKAARVVRLVDNVERQFTVTDQAGRDLLNDPDAWATVRQLAMLKDRTAIAMDEKTSSLPRIVTVVFQTTRSLFDIATELAQDPQDLMNLNSRLENFLAIESGTIVRVFER